MSSLIEYAEREMDLAWGKTDDMQNLVKDNVIELLKVFEAQGHSGFSAPYVLDIFNTLASFKPLSELTGNDDEWLIELNTNNLLINKRSYNVLKDCINGNAWRYKGRVFFDEGSTVGYTNFYSKKFIKFPYQVTGPDKVTIKQSCVDFTKDNACQALRGLDCYECSNCAEFIKGQ